MRTMYDGINSLAAGIHSRFPNAAMVAGYIDGLFKWTQAEWDLFPNAVKVKVAVFASTNGGDVIDCETGDATPAQAAAWVRMRRTAGYYRPTIYCNLSTVPAVRAATGSLVLGSDYDIWLADYDGSTAATYPGIAAKQYNSFTAYDISVVYHSSWPQRTAPAPPPAPSPAPDPTPDPVLDPTTMEDDMQIPPGSSGPDVGVSFNGAPYNTIGFLADPSRIGATQTQVRCAFHNGKGATFAVLTATITPDLPKTVVLVPDGSDGVSFHRLDDVPITLIPNFA